ncbi:hypothetical protein BJF93_17600 [Xaviernesmea oryzae]|uniref:Uncharacterized protein n=1 Tax=Xaviernesmea oryzae TaxID=464029 RepID=A0A1Q9AT86_9HYPH|nr:hypothetical protein BJF93_17600 [Xaviernesmea oryzae]
MFLRLFVALSAQEAHTPLVALHDREERVMTTVLEYFAWFDLAILCGIAALMLCSYHAGGA